MPRRLPSVPATSAPLLPVLLVSSVALAYELLLTRMFAIVHWHHLVATVIGLALLGYGASGTFLALFGSRLRRHFAAAFVTNALLFAAATATVIQLAQALPFEPGALLWDPRQAAWFALMLLLLSLPLFAAANCIGLALAHFPEQIPRIYGVDLLGAALGALLLTTATVIFHPSQVLWAVLISGLALAVLSAWRLQWHPGPVAVVAGMVVAMAAITGSTAINPAPYKDLSRSLATLGARVEHQLSSPGGVLHVVANDRVPNRHVPGLSLNSSAIPPRQHSVFIDGDHAGSISDRRGGDGSDRVLGETLSALPYRLFDSPSVALVEAGFDLRPWQAAVLGAKGIVVTGVDPQHHRLLCERFPAITGSLCHPAATRWLLASPRGFAVSVDDTFDLISLRAAADPMGLDALEVDYGLTAEAIRAYLLHLQPGGVVAIEAPTRLPPALSRRLLASARQALVTAGVERPGDHIALVRGWQRFLLLISERPFDPPRTAVIRDFSARWGFDLAWLPDLAATEVNRYQHLRRPFYHDAAADILSDDGTAVADGAGYESGPATDDRPFPHRVSTFRELLAAAGSRDVERLRRIDAGLLIASLTLAIAGVASALLIALPLALQRLGRSVPIGLRLRVLGYFALLGPAFLFTEIAWIQRLELFLDQPLYAAAIALTIFLLFAGVGSLMAQRCSERTASALVIGAVLLIAGYALLSWLGWLGPLAAASTLPFIARLGLALLLLAPLALAMGVPFSVALRHFGALAPALIPWAWAINGCASVISATAAALLAPAIGFSGLILVAATAYLVLPLLLGGARFGRLPAQ